MNVFDIIGPVMIGPSSSHTAGAVRLGRVAWKILGERAVKAQIQLSGSFAHTYRGHGTDKALIAGIMGMHSDDERIRRSLSIAQEEGLLFSFTEEDIPGAHPNTPVSVWKARTAPAVSYREPASAAATFSFRRLTECPYPLPDSITPCLCFIMTSRERLRQLQTLWHIPEPISAISAYPDPKRAGRQL